MEVDFMKKVVSLTIVFVMLFTSLSFALDLDPTVKYLKDQNPDGWGILALYANGIDIEDEKLEDIDSSKVTTDYEAYIMGAIPLDKDLCKYAESIENAQRYNGKFADYIDGSGEDLVNAHIWGIISLYAAGEESYNKNKALEWLKENQNPDGGFPVFTGDEISDIDLTAMAIVAYDILGLETNSTEVKEALNFIEKNISRRESCEAISWYIMSRVKLGLDVDSDLYDRLQDYKLEDGGYKHLKMSSRPNYMATWHGLLAEHDYKTKTSILTKLHNQNKFSDLNFFFFFFFFFLKLINKGILSGYLDNTFKPNNNVKRSEFAKFIVYGMGLEGQISGETNEFNDLNKHWSNKIVKIAVKNGLIQGLGNERFGPEDKITGAQVATMLVRAKGLETQAKDISGANWYDGYVQVAKENNLLYDSFKADEYATRAQCAVVIEKIMK